MTIAPVLRAPLFLSPAPVLRAPLSLPTAPLAAEPLPQSHPQVTGCEGLGLAALRHTQRLLAQLLQQALHRSSCVPVENQESAAFIPPPLPVALSNLMVPVVRQLPNAKLHATFPVPHWSMPYCPPQVLTNEDRGGLCNLAHILIWVMGVGRLEGNQEPEGEA